MWPALLPFLGSLIDKLIPDKTAAAAAKAKLDEIEQNGELQLLLGQLDVNKTESASTNLFIAGWRPFVGWICGVAFLWNFVLGSILSSLLQAFGHPLIFVPLDMTEMLPVLFGLLGLGGYRTYEKVKNVTRND